MDLATIIRELAAGYRLQIEGKYTAVGISLEICLRRPVGKLTHSEEADTRTARDVGAGTENGDGKKVYQQLDANGIVNFLREIKGGMRAKKIAEHLGGDDRLVDSLLGGLVVQGLVTVYGRGFYRLTG